MQGSMHTHAGGDRGMPVWEVGRRASKWVDRESEQQLAYKVA